MVFKDGFGYDPAKLLESVRDSVALRWPTRQSPQHSPIFH
jgi:hypothetical protein